jgi:hypothetical protein
MREHLPRPAQIQNSIQDEVIHELGESVVRLPQVTRGFPFSGSFERHELWGLAVIIHR